MNKKVNFFIANDFPEGTAKNARIKAYCLGLKNMGYECEVFAGFSSAFNNYGINSKVAGVWEGIPYRILAGEVRPPRGIWQKIKTVVKANQACLGFLRNNPKDIHLFYMPSLRGIGFAFFISSLFNISKIAIQTEQFSLVHDGFAKLISKIDEYLISKSAKMILVVSDRLETYYSGLNPTSHVQKITPIVVDYKRFEKANDIPTSFTLGYLGTFNPKDGVETIIEAFLKFRKNSPTARLKLIGNSLGFEHVQHEAVEFTGKFQHHELSQHLHQCSVLVVNRLNDTYSRTGFPIKLAEYLATKRPVLLCDFKEYHHYLSDKEVIYFNPNDARDLEEKLLWVYQHRDEAEKIGINGYSKGKTLFDKQPAAEQLNRIFALEN